MRKDSTPKPFVSRSRRVEDAGAATAALESILPMPSVSPYKDHLARLREHVFEAEKICQVLSSAVNTPEMPASAWIYVDVARMAALTTMRAAQLLQLELERHPAPAPAEEKS